MRRFARVVRARLAWSLTAVAIMSLACWPSAEARNYLFENISDLPAGPGGGRSAEVNDSGDIAFVDDGDVWFYDRSGNSFLNVTALPGAPANPFFVKLNNDGNIAIIETATTTPDLWLFEQATQAFTNISAMPNFPATGNTQANFLGEIFDLNDNNRVSFHSGDNNLGDIYVYDHASGNFDKITDMPGGPTRGRENEINNSDQVLYMGFPSAYLFDPASGTTTNINELPGGPGVALTNVDLNDHGDVALMGGSVAQLYRADTGMFLDIAAAPGWPSGSSSSRSDLSNSREITFWRDDLLVFDSNAGRFSQLNNFAGGPPPGGTETDLNSLGQIVLNTGADIYLATPRPYGDYDNDDDVDASDLAVFEATYGDTVAIGTAADGSSNRVVDGQDFLIWQRQYAPGTSSLVSESLTVPEPTSAVLLLATWIGLLGRRIRQVS